MNYSALCGIYALALASAGPALAQGTFAFTAIPVAADAVDGSNRAVGLFLQQNNNTDTGAVWANGAMTLVAGTAELQAVNSNGLAAGYGAVPKKHADDHAMFPRSPYAKANYVTYDIGSGVTTTYTPPKGTTVVFFSVGGINDDGVAVADLSTKSFTTTGSVFTKLKYP